MPKNYAYTNLSTSGALLLIINQTSTHEISQYNATFAVNEVPEAQCLLAVGRNLRTKKPATINTNNNFLQMMSAIVTFTPSGDYAPDGTKWPKGTQTIFQGYFTGFAYRKVMGKLMVIANLIHFTADLGCSSCLTKNGFASNPSALNTAAVFNSVGSPTGAAPLGNMIGSLPIAQRIVGTIVNDVWGGIKTVFCDLANIKTQPAGPSGTCGGTGTYDKNDRALDALKLIEGASPDCPFVPVDSGINYAVPLAVSTSSISILGTVLSTAIGNETIESYASMSFWDKLITQFCPMFGMAFVPCAQRALVIADTPAYNGGVWKTIDNTEYDSLDFNASLERPLRGVGIVTNYATQTLAGVEKFALSRDDLTLIGGCWTEDSVKPGDGMIQFISTPSWLQIAVTAGAYSGFTTNSIGNGVGRAGGADALGKDATGTLGTNLNELYKAFAHDVYVKNMLRGRAGSLSGKLRFDIAPGSIVKIIGKADQFLAGDDSLAIPLYACVSRVTITINAEAAMAATSFAFTHIRTAAEYTQPRTSIDSHPLFGKSIHGGGLHGCPLVPAYDFPDYFTD